MGARESLEPVRKQGINVCFLTGSYGRSEHTRWNLYSFTGPYDLYLDAAFRSDRFIRRVWETIQRMPAYANSTALVLATDHGRGAANADWTDHGRKVPAAEATWMAVMGPGTPALGVRESVTVSTAQVAATVAALLGEDFRRGVPAAAPPLPGIGR
jgi:hypothetical protein